jgi:hypothetical protein
LGVFSFPSNNSSNAWSSRLQQDRRTASIIKRKPATDCIKIQVLSNFRTTHIVNGPNCTNSACTSLKIWSKSWDNTCQLARWAKLDGGIMWFGSLMGVRDYTPKPNGTDTLSYRPAKSWPSLVAADP